MVKVKKIESVWVRWIDSEEKWTIWLARIIFSIKHIDYAILQAVRGQNTESVAEESKIE